jgi:hypothetical protein
MPPMSAITQPSPVVVQAAPKPPTGVKTGKKYVLATDATDVCYTQRSLTRARAHARPYRELEISVATVADFHSESPRESERTVATVAESGASKRIAGELVKMHKDGAISGLTIPKQNFMPRFFTPLAGPTGAPRTKKKPHWPIRSNQGATRCRPVRLTAKQRAQFLQDDLDSLNEE